MKNTLGAFFCGALFSAGLAISGMTDPRKVVGFLDFSRGHWDPSLAFVMAGAVAVYLIAQKLVLKRQGPLFDSGWHLPDKKDINLSLLTGAALFGVGWGLSGYCPGPALVSLVSLQTTVWIFVVSMFVGMLIVNIARSKLNQG